MTIWHRTHKYSPPLNVNTLFTANVQPQTYAKPIPNTVTKERKKYLKKIPPFCFFVTHNLVLFHTNVGRVSNPHINSNRKKK